MTLSPQHIPPPACRCSSTWNLTWVPRLARPQHALARARLRVQWLPAQAHASRMDSCAQSHLGWGGSQVVKYDRSHDPRPLDTRPSMTDGWIDGDVILPRDAPPWSGTLLRGTTASVATRAGAGVPSRHIAFLGLLGYNPAGGGCGAWNNYGTQWKSAVSNECPWYGYEVPTERSTKQRCQPPWSCDDQTIAPGPGWSLRAQPWAAKRGAPVPNVHRGPAGRGQVFRRCFCRSLERRPAEPQKGLGLIRCAHGVGRAVEAASG
jgi:hypothetical protein